MNKKMLKYSLLLLGVVAFAILKWTNNREVASGPMVIEDTSEVITTNDKAPSRGGQRVVSEKKKSHEPFYTRPFQQGQAELVNDPNDPQSFSDFMIQSEDPKYTEVDIVESLEMLLVTYRMRVSGGYYETNSNIEITNALLGDNPRKIAFLSANSRRIDKDGKLVDGYGSPYNFHLISGKRMIIRSAGQDLELYTDDDIISAREDELSEGVSVSGVEGFTVDP